MGGLFQGSWAVMAEQCTGRGVRGVVAAAAPIAASIGADVLRRGGNAFDAVVAAALAETVLLPPKCGLAGDLIALSVSAGATEPEALLAIGGAPDRLAAEAVAGRLTTTGPLSVGVPAAPAGYAALAERARFPLDALAASAIALARDGFPWAPICTVLTNESAILLRAHNPSGTVYLPNGRAPAPGEATRLPGLASALEEFTARGAALFDGPVGDALLRTVAGAGGVIERSDLQYARAEWCAPAVGNAHGVHLWATPAPTHGPSTLEAVAATPKGAGPGAAWDAVLAAIRRRRDTLCDPSGTSMVSAADAEGNAVVVIHSNSFPQFGSGLVVREYDLVLNNRAGRGFTDVEGHPNFPAPGRRPATTLHAWAAGGEDGGVAFLGATPGGANQMPWNVQSLVQLLGGERRPGALVTAPRWEWLPDCDGVRIEEGFAAADAETLAGRAPVVERTPQWGLRSAQQVIARPLPGETIVAAVDPRTGGAAIGV